jgi:hypothetical protein
MSRVYVSGVIITTNCVSLPYCADYSRSRVVLNTIIKQHAAIAGHTAQYSSWQFKNSPNKSKLFFSEFSKIEFD